MAPALVLSNLSNCTSGVTLQTATSGDGATFDDHAA